MFNERIAQIHRQVELEREALERKLDLQPKRKNKKTVQVAQNWKFGGSDIEWLENDGPKPDWSIMD